MSIFEDPTFRSAREALADATSIVFFTGAGLGAESGIPTFRGAGGLWEGFRAEELASPDGFARHPEKVWEWYQWRRDAIAAAEPHDGHRAIARRLARRSSDSIVTQNVDGLHARAAESEGHDVDRIIELHGNIWRTHCHRCRQESAAVERFNGDVPRCECGGSLRPGVVWFGESLPADAWQRADRAIEGATAMVVVGTSGVVEPAASLARHAIGRGAAVVEVNPDPVLAGALALAGPAAELLPPLLGPDDGV